MDDKTFNLLKDDYLKNNLTLKECADKYEMSIEGIRKALKRNNITVRSISDALSYKWGTINKSFTPTEYRGVFERDGLYYVADKESRAWVIYDCFKDKREAATKFNEITKGNILNNII